MESSHGLVLALRALRPRSATLSPGRRLAHVGGPSEQTSAGGGGLGSGSHLQPPDRDLSWAALRCSPDLTQSFPKAAGRPFPGSAPRRPPDATGPTQKRPLPLPPLARWATRGSSRVWGRGEGKGHLLNHLLHHLPASLPSSLSFSRYEIFVWVSMWALVRSHPPHRAPDPEAYPHWLGTKDPLKGK